MSRTSDPIVQRVGELLDELAASERLSNDSREVAHDRIVNEFRELPREGLVEKLDQAARNKRRKKVMVFFLAELSDDPKAVERIGEELRTGDKESRSCLIQTIAHAKLVSLAPLLNDVIRFDEDEFCRYIAIGAAGALGAEANFPTILELVERGGIPANWRLLSVMTEFGRPEFRPYLMAAFRYPGISKDDKTMAAWGLGKFGDREAILYLKEMLGEQDVVMFRAAQALCEIHGWEFDWSRSFIEKHAEEWRIRIGN